MMISFYIFIFITWISLTTTCLYLGVNISTQKKNSQQTIKYQSTILFFFYPIASYVLLAENRPLGLSFQYTASSWKQTEWLTP